MRSGHKMVEPYIETVLGRKFYALSEYPGFNISEIGGALSKLCRYGGHCSSFYSVAEHSVLVADLMKFYHLGDPMEGLLHDATEAYLVDIPGPWKCRLPDYLAMEDALERKFRRDFKLPPEKTPGCKRADWIALMIEGRSLLTSRGQTMIEGGIPAEFGVLADEHIAKFGPSIACLNPPAAFNAFMTRYTQLTENL